MEQSFVLLVQMKLLWIIKLRDAGTDATTQWLTSIILLVTVFHVLILRSQTSQQVNAKTAQACVLNAIGIGLLEDLNASTALLRVSLSNPLEDVE